MRFGGCATVMLNPSCMTHKVYLRTSRCVAAMLVLVFVVAKPLVARHHWSIWGQARLRGRRGM